MKFQSVVLLLSSTMLLACSEPSGHTDEHDHSDDHAAVDAHHDDHGNADHGNGQNGEDNHGDDDHGHDDHGHGDEHADEPNKGPNGGRLLEQAGYRVELAIVEDGVAPHYQAWLYQAGESLKANSGSVRVQLTRLGGQVDVHELAPSGAFLSSASTVEEPHSFDVQVDATIGGKALQWTFESYEGRTRIAAAMAERSGIRVELAAAGTISDTQDVQGILTPIEGRHARVVARFPGPIKAVRVGVGDTVQRGQTLAVVESNISLSDYPVHAPFAGTVMSRNAGVGDLAGTEPLFEIADLRQLWVDLHLFGPGAQQAMHGLVVQVSRLTDGATISTTLDRVLPGTATASQSTIARAILDNADGNWRPGSAVRARITLAESAVDLRVPLSALQSFRDWDVVFIRVGDIYEVRPLTLGRRDRQHVEVLAGLQASDAVVVEQSYLIKADIEKSGAAHDH